MADQGRRATLGETEFELVSEGGVQRVECLRRATQDTAQKRLLSCVKGGRGEGRGGEGERKEKEEEARVYKSTQGVSGHMTFEPQPQSLY